MNLFHTLEMMQQNANNGTATSEKAKSEMAKPVKMKTNHCVVSSRKQNVTAKSCTALSLRPWLPHGSTCAPMSLDTKMASAQLIQTLQSGPSQHTNCVWLEVLPMQKQKHKNQTELLNRFKTRV